MTRHLGLLPLATLLLTSAAFGQVKGNQPRIGYLCPAGGQRGTTFEVIAGGQFLRTAGAGVVSGNGVHVKVIEHYQPLQQVVQQHREEIRRRLSQLIEQRLSELPRGGKDLPPEVRDFLRAGGGGGRKPGAETEELPDHPLLRNLEKKSLRELLHVRNELLNLRQQQPSRQIAETVLIEVTIDRNAALGDHDLRLETAEGLTSPMRFQVGALPEITEREPNDPRPIAAMLPGDASLELPALINGQIKPGDVDRFRFHAHRGQQLAIEVEARRLVPYLADAVPGWFQATITLYDDKNHEVAFADDFRFDPDPVLFYKVPREGDYQVEIRDSLYRGREDFVYRMAVGEQAVVARSFPWISRTVTTSAPAPAGQDELPQVTEAGPNEADQPQQIDLPCVVNGRIAKPGDVDVFQFHGRAGEEIVADVRARRAGSPLDSLLRLSDASGKVLAWNDDQEDKESGLLTHHADSYLRTKLPADGVYSVSIADAEHHGGSMYGYSLRLSAPRPDFALRLAPSSLNIRPGGSAPATIFVVRKDGFEGEIEVILKDAPQGFKLTGARIKGGSERTDITVTAPREPLERPLTLKLEGVASINGHTLRRPVVASEDMMQAFIYRHLVPAEALLVSTIGGRRPLPPMEWAQKSAIKLPAGGTTTLRLKVWRGPRLQTVSFGLRNPPEGITLGAVTPASDGFTLELKADAAKMKPGQSGNLIIEASIAPPAPPTTRPANAPGGKGRRQEQRNSLGVLPAVAFEIVKP